MRKCSFAMTYTVALMSFSVHGAARQFNCVALTLYKKRWAMPKMSLALPVISVLIHAAPAEIKSAHTFRRFSPLG